MMISHNLEVGIFVISDEQTHCFAIMICDLIISMKLIHFTLMKKHVSLVILVKLFRPHSIYLGWIGWYHRCWKIFYFSIFNNILYTEHINLFGPFMKVRARRARGLMNPLCVSLFSPPQPYQRLRSNIDRYFEGHKVCIWLQVCIFCCEKKLAYYGVWYRVGFWMELLWL